MELGGAGVTEVTKDTGECPGTYVNVGTPYCHSHLGPFPTPDGPGTDGYVFAGWGASYGAVNEAGEQVGEPVSTVFDDEGAPPAQWGRPNGWTRECQTSVGLAVQSDQGRPAD